MMKKLLSIILTFAAIVNIYSIDIGFAAEDPPVVLRLAYLPENGSLEDSAAREFKKYIEEKSNKNITIHLFPGGQLGSEGHMTEQCQFGTTEMVAVGEIAAVNAAPEYATIMRVPYLFDSYAHLETYLNSKMGDTGKTIMDILRERRGLRTLGYYNRGARQLTANKAVRSVEDLKHLSLRVPDVAVQVAAWRMTGAIPTAISAGELYLSLNQGLVNAQENPVDFIKGYALNEVQSHIMETNHNYGMRWILINDKIYQSLTDQQKAVLEDAVKHYVNIANESISAEEKSTWQWFAENGMTVIRANEIDYASIKNAIMSGVDSLSKGWAPCCLEICEATRTK